MCVLIVVLILVFRCGALLCSSCSCSCFVVPVVVIIVVVVVVSLVVLLLLVLYRLCNLLFPVIVSGIVPTYFVT